MSHAEAFVSELTQEAVATRRLLERVPEEKLSWRPHPKSDSLGQLALHIASVPGAIAELVRGREAEAPDVPRPEARSRAELLDRFDASVVAARSRLEAWSDAELGEQWRFTRNGRTLFELPRGGVIRTVLFNHWYHHRGQLTVYLRLLDVALPGVYGPTADEQI